MTRAYSMAVLLLVSLIFSISIAQCDRSKDSLFQEIEKHRNWRAAWWIELSVWPDSVPVPDSVIISLNNLSSDTLHGTNLLLQLYRVDAYAFDKDLREKEIRLPPGETKSLFLTFRSLVFHDYRGQPIDTVRLFERMRTGPWRMKCSLSDLRSSKPPTESSFLVESNTVEFKSKK